MGSMTFHEDRGYMCADGPATAKGYFCNKKLCIVATDLAYLTALLEAMLRRDDCFFVKYSPTPKDGMHLGRIFLTTPAAVGALWKQFKDDPKLMCSIQDDDFTSAYRVITVTSTDKPA
jgi:hypothetical protein